MGLPASLLGATRYLSIGPYPLGLLVDRIRVAQEALATHSLFCITGRPVLLSIDVKYHGSGPRTFSRNMPIHCGRLTP